jgi:outer membrane protein TolC
LDLDKQTVDTEEAERQLMDLLGVQTLPPLGETIDLGEKTVYLDPEIAGSVGRAVNPQLTMARHSILKRKAELRALAMAWIPNLKLTGDFSVSGKQYPLTHYAWTVGAVIQVSTPYLSGSAQGSGGMDGPYDKTARLRSNAEALPDPASGLDVPAAQLALRQEEQNYELLVGQVERKIKTAVKVCRLLEQKRDLAAQAVRVGQQKRQLLEVRSNLGQITRLELMKGQIETVKREEALVSAAVDLLGAERDLEILLDLSPGDLGNFSRRYGRMG